MRWMSSCFGYGMIELAGSAAQGLSFRRPGRAPRHVHLSKRFSFLSTCRDAVTYLIIVCPTFCPHPASDGSMRLGNLGTSQSILGPSSITPAIF